MSTQRAIHLDLFSIIKIRTLIFSLALIILLIGQASAGSYEINGTTYDTTWDGRIIPSSQIVYGSNDDVILVQELIPATAFTSGNDTIYLNNNFTSFKREKFKISPIMTFPKTLLASRMVNVNATVGYLLFPYNLSRTKDFVSDNIIFMGNWTFRAGKEHIDVYDDNETQNVLNKSAYEFRIINDEIRLYFLKSEANKLQGNITFEMNSWTINGSTTPAWINSTQYNLTVSGANLIIKNKFFEGFDGNLSSYISMGNPNITNSKLILNGTASGRIISLGSYLSDANYTVSFDWNSTSLSNGALAFTYRGSAWSGTMFLMELISSSQIRTRGTANGWNVYGYNSSLSLQSNTKYNSKISIYGNKHMVFLDNILLYEFSDSNYSTSKEWSFQSTVSGSILTIDNISIYTEPNYLVSYYDSGSGNETYQIDVNATTPTNTNYTLWYGNNASESWSQLGGTLAGNNSLTISGTKYQNTDVQVRLAGNTTATPELIQITFFDQAVSGGAGDFIPPTPISLSNTTDNFWVNHTWQAGSGNITNSYNFSQNGTWTNGSSATFKNVSVGAHNWSNISVYAFNSSGNRTLNQTPASMNTQAPNNPPFQAAIGNKQVTAGQWLNFTVSATDLDSDTITYGTNASNGTFNTGTGNFNWSTTGADVGTYFWNFNSSDAYGGVDDENITVTVNSAEPASFTHTIFGAWE